MKCREVSLNNNNIANNIATLCSCMSVVRITRVGPGYFNDCVVKTCSCFVDFFLVPASDGWFPS